MNPELSQQLIAKYPHLFSRLSWGPECDDGWFNILMALGDALTYSYSTTTDLKLDGIPTAPEHIKWDNPEMDNYQWRYTGVPEGILLVQVKEKFGILRVYTHIEYNPEFEAKAGKYPKTAQMIELKQSYYIDGIVRMAEAISARTCEISGKPGVLHVAGGWVKTLSPEVAKSSGCAYRPYSEVQAQLEAAPQS
jgi:hypothetical protein